MKLEHVAFNVQDPLAVAEWYARHLGLAVVRRDGAPYFTHFLADDGGAMLIEIYCNPPGEVPHYAAMNPLVLHLAFVSADPDADKTALLAAGATLVSEARPDAQTHLVMLRDPWGLAIQLCKRGAAMLKETGSW
jgi:catechol 2,3-dioxygenase-like lactoylglutathione lyase family enzyme